jgi:uncharacterized protein (DUF1499 family)
MPAILFQVSLDAARREVKEAVLSMPRTRAIADEPDYLHVEFRSFLFGFVDDVEFVFDSKARRIDFRSASRTGYSDLGANRRRMSFITERLLQRPGFHLAR